MKDELLKIIDNNLTVEEIDGRTFLHLPLYELKDMSPNFVVELIKTDNEYKLSDMKSLVRSLIEEDTLNDYIIDKINELAPTYRLTVEKGEVSATFSELEDIKYFVSYMFAFVSVINYLSKNN